ncbi:hypothetical protein HPB51_006736 [Rhipicephalus microplus]|uniref:Peroxisome assembly protein 12 n=1 Tax=Rhipicephalus microplus TaxID=6941 RepID=A0A9J6E874_RHIMP|nr:hypothetical protein HPB51_006736 [Rhipicephalus microplus]
MAEYGAHLATHLAQKPSIFEVLAQENLARALRNALRHLISYFADLRSGKRPQALVLDDELPGRGWIGTLRRLYPAFSLACEAASLSYALFYAIGKSPVHSPALSLSSVRLEVAPSVPASPDPNAGRTVRIVRGVADAFSATLATAAFLLHFVDWWNSQKKGSLVAEPPVPAPPLVDEQTRQAPQSFTRRGHCPLCLSEISDRAAVLTTSGYVFCYDCIRNHLSSGRTTCPVTGYPSSHESVVLLVGQ